MTSQNNDLPSAYNPSFPVTWNELIEIYANGLSLDKYDEIKMRKTVPEGDVRTDTVYEILKAFGFSCPGGELTPVCDMCGATPYCVELRRRRS